MKTLKKRITMAVLSAVCAALLIVGAILLADNNAISARAAEADTSVSSSDYYDDTESLYDVYITAPGEEASLGDNLGASNNSTLKIVLLVVAIVLGVACVVIAIVVAKHKHKVSYSTTYDDDDYDEDYDEEEYEEYEEYEDDE